jgi:type IV pilus assembly protein PilB
MAEEIIDLGAEIIRLITPEQAFYYNILPKSSINGHLEFYHSSENEVPILDELELVFGKRITLHNISSLILKKNLSKYYLKENGIPESFENKTDSDNFLFNLIEEANNLQSSDIHIEAYETHSRIRLRVDGKLFERYIIKKEEYPALINKIKILANLDIAEKRLPQDGRILFSTDKGKNDIRVSIIPSLYGEKIVLRLLQKSASEINIRKLGFSPEQLSDYLTGIKKPNGIILISGPTGSGKTTTLYATLNLLNNKDVNILTIEDPVEYTLQGINQVQLRENIGLTFSKALRTFLRQDPDIIMLGEIRDPETAQMAIRAALTGHLVLSTIHTNSAWGIITRLADMGIPPFLLSSTINSAVAQRLLRKLCEHCKKEEKFEKDFLPRELPGKYSVEKHFVAKGCELCHNTGYSGRMAVFEVIEIDRELKNLIRCSKFDIGNILLNKKVKSLADSAFELFAGGITSLEEALPVFLSES